MGFTKWRPSLFLPIAAFIAAFFLPATAFAKIGVCLPTKEMMDTVRANKMVIVFRGLSEKKHLVTIYTDKEKNFLAIVHYHTRMSCIADKGAKADSLHPKKINLAYSGI